MKRHDRFMADPMPIRLGGIAANLARIGSCVSDPRNVGAVLDMIEESKWFIEWAAPSAEVDVAARLAEIQISLAVSETRLRSGAEAAGQIAQAASEWSDEVLQMSGLLD